MGIDFGQQLLLSPRKGLRGNAVLDTAPSEKMWKCSEKGRKGESKAQRAERMQIEKKLHGGCPTVKEV